MKQFFQCDQPRPMQSGDSAQQNGECPGSPHSADSNSNAPSSSHAQSTPLRIDETNITPSISLIPIKQEPTSEETYDKNRNSINGNNCPSGGGGGNSSGAAPVNLSTSPSGSVQMQSATSSSLSMIKVSPLKSLLREDLKRKIVSRSSSSRARASTVSPHANAESGPGEPIATTTNGTITSTASEQPSDSSWRSAGKRTLSSLQCIFCGIGFPDQTLYFLHKGCHSDSNPWKCNICGEQCSNVYEFNSHLLSKSHQ